MYQFNKVKSFEKFKGFHNEVQNHLDKMIQARDQRDKYLSQEVVNRQRVVKSFHNELRLEYLISMTCSRGEIQLYLIYGSFDDDISQVFHFIQG